MELVTLKTFDNAIDVHILKNRLESEGITCFVFDEHIVSAYPLYSLSVGGIKLKVREEDVESAKEILKDIYQTPLTDELNSEIICPSCESKSIESGHKTLKGLKGIISGFISFFFMVFPIYMKQSYHCNDCGHDFQKKRTQ